MNADQDLAPSAPDHEGAGEVVDRRTLALVLDYARLSGAAVDRPNPHLLRLRVPAEDARHFANRTEHLLALDVAGVERYPESELPVIGGSFWTGLLNAIRQRGHRRVSGVLPITVTAAADAPDVSVTGATLALTERTRETRRVVQLSTRVSLAAGTSVHEEVVQSDAIDLTTGHDVPASLSALLASADVASHDDVSYAAATGADRLVPAIIRGLEEKVADRVQSLHTQAERNLAHELARIDRYYSSLESEVRDASGAGSDALRTIQHEHDKRRTEEMRRHQVRVDVEPLQVLERAVIAERVTWRLTTPAGRTADLNAQRYLTGDGAWGVHCPSCGTTPEQITVCRSGHAIGIECVTTCSVCSESFCAEHGYPGRGAHADNTALAAGGCAIDGAPVCRDDAAQCFSCDRVHCTAHQATCDDGHAACVECIVECAVCTRAVCRKHSFETHEHAPRGERLVCSRCVVYCEDGTSEPVGIDEAAQCGTCGSYICERHQTLCVVDRQPHCSKHLKRADRSRRFMCEAHVATCDREPQVAFAQDEVHACVECGRVSCDKHGAACHEDQRWHCWDHLVVLNDIPDGAGCTQHRSTCHIDDRTFSLAGTSPCEVCARTTCRTHMAPCDWCGAPVCIGDMQAGRCVTCTKLAPAIDPPDEVISAGSRVAGDRNVKQWLISRDGSRFVVQLELGWTRRVVFSVPHGSATAVRVVRHSMFGSSGVGK